MVNLAVLIFSLLVQFFQKSGHIYLRKSSLKNTHKCKQSKSKKLHKCLSHRIYCTRMFYGFFDFWCWLACHWFYLILLSWRLGSEFCSFLLFGGVGRTFFICLDNCSSINGCRAVIWIIGSSSICLNFLGLVLQKFKIFKMDQFQPGLNYDRSLHLPHITIIQNSISHSRNDLRVHREYPPQCSIMLE